MSASRWERRLYRAARLLGDARAIRRGSYPRRLARRTERRLIWGLLRKGGL